MSDAAFQYTLADFGDMLCDARRVAAYRGALEAAIVPGCTVLDIGTGTGAMALLAVTLGAGHVHAIEPNPAIHAARELARHNGIEDRITFHQAMSTDVSLPERAHVLVSDLRGVTPFFQTHIPTIVDARERLLTPDATLVPARDTVRAALVEAPESYRRLVGPWDDRPLGIDMAPLRSYGISALGRIHAEADQQLTDSALWCELDYATHTAASMDGSLAFEARREGTAHGLAVWFDAEHAPGITYLNAPGQPRGPYGQQFFPLEQPLTLARGDRVSVELKARHVDDGYLWQWNTTLEPVAGEARTFRQSTAFAAPLDTGTIHRRSEDYAGPLTEEGRWAVEALQQLDEGRSIAAVAARLRAQAPERFPSSADAHTFVADLAVRYGA